MMRVLIIGGYGNFGSFIASMLKDDTNIRLILVGRNLKKAAKLAASFDAANPIEIAKLDINEGLDQALNQIKPDLVIHTSGPYQNQSYHVAEACIKYGCHYTDLADGREFVANIDQLDDAAIEKQILICAGASSVPCLTSAIIDEYLHEFECLKMVEYAITTAQRTNRGLATIRAVMSYAGKPFMRLKGGKMQPVYGWQDLKWRNFWGLNKRGLANIDIPDLEIFPKRYPSLKHMDFKAGLELKLLHIMMVFMARLVRWRLLPSLVPLSKILLNISYLFDKIGQDDSGFYMQLSGKNDQQKDKEILFELVARAGDGLCIPSVPAIILAKKLAAGSINQRGATPCIGLITLDEYLDVLGKFQIEWRVS